MKEFFQNNYIWKFLLIFKIYNSRVVEDIFHEGISYDTKTCLGWFGDAESKNDPHFSQSALVFAILQKNSFF